MALTRALHLLNEDEVWAFWRKANGKGGKRVTATLHWQSRKQTILVRCLLSPPELRQRGFHTVDDRTAATETLNCDLFLYEQDWARRTSDILAALEASANKAGR